MTSKKNNSAKDASFEKYLSKFITKNDILPTSADELVNKLNGIFNEAYDFIHIKIETTQGLVHFYYFLGMINRDIFQKEVIESLQENNYKMKDLKQHLHISGVEIATDWTELIKELHSGNVVLHVNDSSPLILELKNVESRSLMDPTSEQQIYGSKIGLIENVITNLSLIRKMIKDPRLKSKEFTLGSQTQTKVALLYLDQYVDDEEITFMTKKLNSYNIKIKVMR